MAIIEIVTSVFVTLQSENILKHISALMFVNEIDNRVFTNFVKNGVFGFVAKKNGADEVMARSVKVNLVENTTNSQENDGRRGRKTHSFENLQNVPTNHVRTSHVQHQWTNYR